MESNIKGTGELSLQFLNQVREKVLDYDRDNKLNSYEIEKLKEAALSDDGQISEAELKFIQKLATSEQSKIKDLKSCKFSDGSTISFPDKENFKVVVKLNPVYLITEDTVKTLEKLGVTRSEVESLINQPVMSKDEFKKVIDKLGLSNDKKELILKNSEVKLSTDPSERALQLQQMESRVTIIDNILKLKNFIESQFPEVLQKNTPEGFQGIKEIYQDLLKLDATKCTPKDIKDLYNKVYHGSNINFDELSFDQRVSYTELLNLVSDLSYFVFNNLEIYTSFHPFKKTSEDILKDLENLKENYSGIGVGFKGNVVENFKKEFTDENIPLNIKSDIETIKSILSKNALELTGQDVNSLEKLIGKIKSTQISSSQKQVLEQLENKIQEFTEIIKTNFFDINKNNCEYKQVLIDELTKSVEEGSDLNIKNDFMKLLDILKKDNPDHKDIIEFLNISSILLSKESQLTDTQKSILKKLDSDTIEFGKSVFFKSKINSFSDQTNILKNTFDKDGIDPKLREGINKIISLIQDNTLDQDSKMLKIFCFIAEIEDNFFNTMTPEQKYIFSRFSKSFYDTDKINLNYIDSKEFLNIELNKAKKVIESLLLNKDIDNIKKFCLTSRLNDINSVLSGLKWNYIPSKEEMDKLSSTIEILSKCSGPERFKNLDDELMIDSYKLIEQQSNKLKEMIDKNEIPSRLKNEVENKIKVLEETFNLLKEGKELNSFQTNLVNKITEIKINSYTDEDFKEEFIKSLYYEELGILKFGESDLEELKKMGFKADTLESIKALLIGKEFHSEEELRSFLPNKNFLNAEKELIINYAKTFFKPNFTDQTIENIENLITKIPKNDIEINKLIEEQKGLSENDKKVLIDLLKDFNNTWGNIKEMMNDPELKNNKDLQILLQTLNNTLSCVLNKENVTTLSTSFTSISDQINDIKSFATFYKDITPQAGFTKGYIMKDLINNFKILEEDKEIAIFNQLNTFPVFSFFNIIPDLPEKNYYKFTDESLKSFMEENPDKNLLAFVQELKEKNLTFTKDLLKEILLIVPDFQNNETKIDNLVDIILKHCKKENLTDKTRDELRNISFSELLLKYSNIERYSKIQKQNIGNGILKLEQINKEEKELVHNIDKETDKVIYDIFKTETINKDNVSKISEDFTKLTGVELIKRKGNKLEEVDVEKSIMDILNRAKNKSKQGKTSLTKEEKFLLNLSEQDLSKLIEFGKKLQEIEKTKIQLEMKIKEMRNNEIKKVEEYINVLETLLKTEKDPNKKSELELELEKSRALRLALINNDIPIDKLYEEISRTSEIPPDQMSPSGEVEQEGGALLARDFYTYSTKETWTTRIGKKTEIPPTIRNDFLIFLDNLFKHGKELTPLEFLRRVVEKAIRLGKLELAECLLEDVDHHFDKLPEDKDKKDYEEYDLGGKRLYIKKDQEKIFWGSLRVVLTGNESFTISDKDGNPVIGKDGQPIKIDTNKTTKIIRDLDPEKFKRFFDITGSTDSSRLLFETCKIQKKLDNQIEDINQFKEDNAETFMRLENAALNATLGDIANDLIQEADNLEVILDLSPVPDLSAFKGGDPMIDLFSKFSEIIVKVSERIKQMVAEKMLAYLIDETIRQQYAEKSKKMLEEHFAKLDQILQNYIKKHNELINKDMGIDLKFKDNFNKSISSLQLNIKKSIETLKSDNFNIQNLRQFINKDMKDISKSLKDMSDSVITINSKNNKIKSQLYDLIKINNKLMKGTLEFISLENKFLDLLEGKIPQEQKSYKKYENSKKVSDKPLQLSFVSF